jgi:predicted nucleic acid-binding protein
MFLVDTNVWLERLLDQDRAAEVGDFLNRFPSEWLFMTDFVLHSVGIVLSRFNQLEALSRFVQDAFVDGAVVLIHLYPDDTENILHTIQEFHLDFDDAYQYVSAEKYDLTLVSFDSDFDHIPRGKKTPGKAMQHR